MWRFARQLGRRIRRLWLPAGIEALGVLLATQRFGWQLPVDPPADR